MHINQGRLRARSPVSEEKLTGTWKLEGDSGLGAIYVLSISNSAYTAVTPVNAVYARHLTETDGLVGINYARDIYVTIMT